ncbi:hypothetical protein [Haloimpatiens massiliensis]|uniref:hypothetical protein n=1 Tax=Haloimpatiens massiliensis TaxID=1658110 RepID=UPI000C86719B|nr:hypothetical protein [Haloimpatiens massiliensis]
MTEFQDLSKYTLEEKEEIIVNRYKKQLRFAGKKHGVIKKISSINNNVPFVVESFTKCFLFANL